MRVGTQMRAILAINDDNVIGLDGDLPWAYNEMDMAWFVNHTRGCPVVMGSSTWNSDMPTPLPNRTNFVLSSQDQSEFEGAIVCSSVAEIRNMFMEVGILERAFVIGGAKTYKAFAPYITEWYVTRMKSCVVDAFGSTETQFHLDYHLSQCTKTFELDHKELTFQIWKR